MATTLLFPNRGTVFRRLSRTTLTITPIRIRFFNRLDQNTTKVFTRMSRGVRRTGTRTGLLRLLNNMNYRLLMGLRRMRKCNQLSRSLRLLCLAESDVVTSLSGIGCFFRGGSPYSMFLFQRRKRGSFLPRADNVVFSKTTTERTNTFNNKTTDISLSAFRREQTSPPNEIGVVFRSGKFSLIRATYANELLKMPKTRNTGS